VASKSVGPIFHLGVVALCLFILAEPFPPQTGDKEADRRKGSEPAPTERPAKGAVKQALGKAVGDAKLESDGKADKIEGKVQNAIRGLKDTLRGK
jgi:uncharacterized protein YjbJ (UPF0337 family)